MGLRDRLIKAVDRALLGDPEKGEQPATERGARRIAKDHGWKPNPEAKNAKSDKPAS